MSNSCRMTDFIDTKKKPLDVIERSIIKTYRKELWQKFVKAIREYKLVSDGDKVAVAISGGKDSLLMAKMFEQLKRQSQLDFEVEYIGMDPGYHKEIRRLLEDNCKYLNIPIKIFDSQIFEISTQIAGDYPCYMCARMRRGALYEFAKKLGCNKLALGHHYNDAIETIMLNILYAGSFKTMLPKLKSANFKNMELIRPLYLIEERDIIRFINNSGVMALNCACMVTSKKTGTKRDEIKDLIADLKKINPVVEKNIFKSAQNVYMGSILGWRDKKENPHSYLEDF